MLTQKPIICLDAGHYAYYNQSPANKNYWESKAMWKLTMMQKKYLEELGFEVILTRDNQELDLELTARGRKATGCVLAISNHSNAVGSYVNEDVDYAVVYRLFDDTTTNCDDISEEIAYIIAPVIAEVMGTKQAWAVKQRLSDNDRNYDGIFNDNYYGFLHGARTVGVPALILEHSFHTNTRITNWLLDDSNLERLAKAEAYAIASYYKLTKKEDATLTKIMGDATAIVEQMATYIREKNPNVAQSVIDMIPLYLSEGKAEGVRGDIAFAQSCLETGNFGFSNSAVTLDQNNFCGMGVTSNGMKGNSFDTPQFGIRAQIQHLKAYASTDALANNCVDPRFKYVTRGCAEYVEWLGQKENPEGKGWATGAGYGAKIVAILNAITAIKITTIEKEECWYRVRKSWEDAKSQIGAYKILDNAKKPENCPEGYTVYDWNGNAVYPIKNVEPPKAEPIVSVLEWQEAAIKDGFELPIYGADGLWGDECKGVAEIAIVKNRGKDNYLYRNLTKLVQKAVGLIGDDIDGMCYDQTEKYIIAYQKAHNLKPDGCVGINTWKVILGV